MQSVFVRPILKSLGFKSAVKNAHFVKKSGPAADRMILGVLFARLLGPRASQVCASSGGSLLPSSKSAFARFMASPYGSWNSLLMQLGARAARMAARASGACDGCIAFDDSVLAHPGARRMEGVTWTFDHNLKLSVRGFLDLQCVWVDGFSIFSLGSLLLKSDEDSEEARKKHRSHACRNPKVKKVDGRSSGAAIRARADIEKPALVREWILRCKRRRIPFKYVLMDSWFASEELMKFIKAQGRDAIGMLKFDKSHYYRFSTRGTCRKRATLKDMAESFPSTRHRGSREPNIIGSEILLRKKADPNDEGIKIRVVYVTSYSRSGVTLAIGSTDLSLSPERIVQLYDRRWGIEVNFKNQKQPYGLDSECWSTDFDSLSAYANMACLRELFFEVKRRMDEDPRTAGELFRNMQTEIRDRPVSEAIDRLFQIVERIPGLLQEAVCIVKGKLKKAQRIVEDLLCSWFSDQCAYARNLILRYGSAAFDLLRRHGVRLRELQKLRNACLAKT